MFLFFSHFHQSIFLLFPFGSLISSHFSCIFLFLMIFLLRIFHFPASLNVALSFFLIFISPFSFFSSLVHSLSSRYFFSSASKQIHWVTWRPGQHDTFLLFSFPPSCVHWQPTFYHSILPSSLLFPFSIFYHGSHSCIRVPYGRRLETRLERLTNGWRVWFWASNIALHPLVLRFINFQYHPLARLLLQVNSAVIPAPASLMLTSL